jgi:hypothetical protein
MPRLFTDQRVGMQTGISSPLVLFGVNKPGRYLANSSENKNKYNSNKKKKKQKSKPDESKKFR